MKRAAFSVILLLCLPLPVFADALSDTRDLYQAITIRIAILKTLLNPLEEPVRTADDIQRLVYRPIFQAETDFMMKAAAVAGTNNPYRPYSVCHQAALDFKFYVGEVQYALKTSKPLPETATDRDYRVTLSACATAIGGR